jgi:hypothetical protein
MADLRPGARALVRAGRAAFRPQAEDRERVLQSLTRTLGESATLGAVRRTDPPAAVTGSAALSSWVLGGVGVLAIGAGVVVATHPWTKTSSPVAAPASSFVSVVEPAPSGAVSSVNVEDLPVQVRPDPSTLSGHGTRSSWVARSPSDSLPEEVRLLSKAEQQLNAGHAADALATLGEHERRFPGGALAEERLAARAQSLCALGRTSEAKADLAKLARSHPGSAYVDRARRFCGLDAP